MDDAGSVGMRQSIGNLRRRIEHLIHRHRPGGEPLLQGLAVDQLEGDVELSLGFAEIKDGDDVLVAQRGDGARLAFEPRAQAGVVADFAGRTLTATKRLSLVSNAR